MNNLAGLVSAFPAIFEEKGIVFDENGRVVFTARIEKTAAGVNITTVPAMSIGPETVDGIALFFSIHFHDGGVCEIVSTNLGVTRAAINGVAIGGRSSDRRVRQFLYEEGGSYIRLAGERLAEALGWLPRLREVQTEIFPQVWGAMPNEGSLKVIVVLGESERVIREDADDPTVIFIVSGLPKENPFAELVREIFQKVAEAVLADGVAGGTFESESAEL
jgi:hypothetical protein